MLMDRIPPESGGRTALLEARVSTDVMDRVAFLFDSQEDVEGRSSASPLTKSKSSADNGIPDSDVELDENVWHGISTDWAQIVSGDQSWMKEDDDTWVQWPAEDPVADRLAKAGQIYRDRAEARRKSKCEKEGTYVKCAFQTPKSVAINRKETRDFLERQKYYMAKKRDVLEKRLRAKEQNEKTWVAPPRSKSSGPSRGRIAQATCDWVANRRVCREPHVVQEEREAMEAQRYSFQPVAVSKHSDAVPLEPFPVRLKGYTESWQQREKRSREYIERNLCDETFQPEVGTRTRALTSRGDAVFDELYTNAPRRAMVLEAKQAVRVAHGKFDALADVVEKFGVVAE